MPITQPPRWLHVNVHRGQLVRLDDERVIDPYVLADTADRQRQELELLRGAPIPLVQSPALALRKFGSAPDPESPTEDR